DLARRHVAGEQDVLDVIEHRPALVSPGKQRPVCVRVRNMSHARHARKEARLLSVFAGCKAERPHGTAMKPAQKADEPWPPGHVTRQLERSLNGFGPALTSEHLDGLSHWIERVDLFSQLREALVPIVTGDMQEIVHRVLDGLYNTRM